MNTLTITAKNLDSTWKRYRRHKNVALRNAIVVYYLPYARSVAVHVHRQLPLHIRFDEIFSDAEIGLIQAVQRFDPSNGTGFKSFARYRICGAISDGLRSRDHVPRSVRVKAKLLAKTMNALCERYGREPTDRELARALKIKMDHLRMWILAARIIKHKSLEVIPCRDGEPNLWWKHDFIRNLRADPLDRAETADKKAIRRDAVKEVLKGLRQRDRLLLILYYFDGRTMKQVADDLGISESRVSQLHDEILKWLKKKHIEHRAELMQAVQ